MPGFHLSKISVVLLVIFLIALGVVAFLSLRIVPRRNTDAMPSSSRQSAYFVPPSQNVSATKVQGKIVRITIDPALPDVSHALQNDKQETSHYLVSDKQSLDLSVGIMGNVTGTIIKTARDGIPVLRVESIEIK